MELTISNNTRDRRPLQAFPHGLRHGSRPCVRYAAGHLPCFLPAVGESILMRKIIIVQPEMQDLEDLRIMKDLISIRTGNSSITEFMEVDNALGRN
jgi:hypothetical protein